MSSKKLEDPNRFQNHCDQLVALVKTLQEADSRIRALSQLPPGELSPDRLRILLATRKALGVSDGVANPLGVRASELAAAVPLASRLESSFRALLDNQEKEILRHLKAGVGNPEDPVILSAVFGSDILYIHRPNGSTLIGGPARKLPSGHPLLAALKPDEFFDQGFPVVVLGPANYFLEGPAPKPWYPLDVVISTTKLLRAEQLEQLRSEAAAKATKEAEEQRKIRERPEYQLEETRRRLAALEAEVAARKEQAPEPVPAKGGA